MQSDETAAVENVVSDYYTGKLRTHGATHRGVDWNSSESQELRFDRLLQLCQNAMEPFSIVDFGCGYGAMAEFIERRGRRFTYQGYDLSTAMIETAIRRHSAFPNRRFTAERTAIVPAEYCIASGIFSVRLSVEEAAWERYIIDTLDTLASIGTVGFAFNMLTTAVDSRRPDLYYADPVRYFELCRSRYSRYVALLHDYPLYEFAILVRHSR